MHSAAKQQQTLEAIARFWKMGRAPTTGELVQELGLARESSLTRRLESLQEADLIQIAAGVRGRQRLIELTGKGRAQTGFGIPVLGEIPAGPLQEAIQNADTWLDGVASLLNWGSNDFLLRVKGDSMLGAGILPGDYVQLRPGVQVRSGEIVAAQLCDDGSGVVEATLKYLDFEEGKPTIRLRAANAAYPDREVEASCVTVAGVYRGLIRIGA